MTDLRDAYDRVKRRIEARYEIAVSIGDVVDPNTGDFDGMRIQVDYDQEMDAALFVLVHLFGHTVQWNVSAEYRALGADLSVGKGEAELARINDYEKNATRYSLQLLHEAGVADLDRWVSDWWHADWRYLRHYYVTGEKLDFRTLLRPGDGEQLTPLPIPDFTPQRWISRWSF
ncbi:MAG TPA: hypothetical protein VG389_03100 [Myxococcota bacterium]|jgi:hypothetical protein|nr:hypothetical protein [Myxococcota bacterium]